MSAYFTLPQTVTDVPGPFGQYVSRVMASRCHAEYYRNVFKRVVDNTPPRLKAEWLADCAREIDNLRVALDWSFSSATHVAIGMELAATYVPYWRDCLQFYEYFHGDNGAGLGASHQTGWSGFIARAMHFFPPHCGAMARGQ